MATIIREQLESAFKEPKTIRDVADLFGVSERTIRRLMKEYGLEPWGKPFAKGYKVKCLDGHQVTSLGEAKIDDWLYDLGIPHAVHKKLQGIPCVVDFWLYLISEGEPIEVGLEYVGVEGIPEYTERVAKKQQLYEFWRIPVIWIYPDTPLDHRIFQQIQQVVRDCRTHRAADQALLRRY